MLNGGEFSEVIVDNGEIGESEIELCRERVRIGAITNHKVEYENVESDVVMGCVGSAECVLGWVVLIGG